MSATRGDGPLGPCGPDEEPGQDIQICIVSPTDPLALDFASHLHLCSVLLEAAFQPLNHLWDKTCDLPMGTHNRLGRLKALGELQHRMVEASCQLGTMLQEAGDAGEAQ